MDKKNTIIGVTLLALAFLLMFTYQPGIDPAEEEAPPRAPDEPAEDVPDEARESPDVSDERPAPAEERRPPPERRTDRPAAEVDYPEDEERIHLENAYMTVTLTNYGGAVREVEFRRFPRSRDDDSPYAFNEESYAPALSLVGFNGAGRDTAFELVERSGTHAVYAHELEGGLEIRRTYSIEPDPEQGRPGAYTVRHETVLANRGDTALQLPYFGFNMGTAIPDVTEARAIGPQFNSFGYFDGDGADFIGMNRFRGGGFLAWIGLRSGEPQNLIERDEEVIWASVSNRFFTTIATFDRPGRGIDAMPVDLPLREGEREHERRMGITGNARFNLPSLEAGGEETIGVEFYVGPKEYRRLQHLDARQDLVMQFGIFGFLSKLLLVMMNGLYSFLPGYGWAIIGTTIIIKTVLWPLTAVAARSSKRMMKISEPMKELREKYKDNPQKMQQETMKLFRQYRVNPLGGCLPILVQIPIFFALFRMLLSASELRLESFLWVSDLSSADTVGHILGFPLNVMPVLMGVTMFFQMKMMPTATVNPMQQKIFMFMPPVITVMLYQFSAGLTLYWTCNNLLTILQQYLINRQKDDIEIEPLPDADDAAGGGKKKRARKKSRKKRK